jgi:hypothetical protein
VGQILCGGGGSLIDINYPKGFSPEAIPLFPPLPKSVLNSKIPEIPNVRDFKISKNLRRGVTSKTIVHWVGLTLMTSTQPYAYQYLEVRRNVIEHTGHGGNDYQRTAHSNQ